MREEVALRSGWRPSESTPHKPHIHRTEGYEFSVLVKKSCRRNIEKKPRKSKLETGCWPLLHEGHLHGNSAK